jgi:hypothetical protein
MALPLLGDFPFVTGINSNDEIVGAYYNSTFTAVTSFTMTESGKKTTTPVQFGGATYVLAGGINSAGTIVGRYCSDGTVSCVYASTGGMMPPPGDPSAFANWQSFLGTPGNLTQITISGSISVLASAINDTGHIAGTFIDASGNYHGFFK